MDDEPLKRKIFTKEQGNAKARHFCAYQERSHYEVRNKLFDWGLYPKDVEEIISELIQENYLNEARFALAYTLGKFRIKGWGKHKIKQGLKIKRISDKLINTSLVKIDDDQYLAKLLEIIDKKSKTISEKDLFKRRYKLMQYALQKGFESDLISDILNNNKLSKNNK